MQYYREQTQWLKIQAFLPEEYRLTQGNLPEEHFFSWGDCEIHLDCYRPKYPKATVVLLHGVGGHGRLLSFLALPLYRSGFEVICPDLPLYGNTAISGTVLYADWVKCAADLVCGYQERGPVFLMGLSAGGMLAYQAAAQCKGVKGVIATCLLDQRIPLVTNKTAANPLLAKIGGPCLAPMSRWFPRLKLPMKWLVNMRAIANNPALVQELLRDKRASGTRVTLEFVDSLLHPEMKIEPQDFLSCPVLLLHPQKDKWTELELSLLFFDRLAGSKTIKVLENAGHFPIEQPGIAQIENYTIEFMSAILRVEPDGRQETANE